MRRNLLVNNSPLKSRAPSITARPAPDEKDRFAELAAARGISESAIPHAAGRGPDRRRELLAASRQRAALGVNAEWSDGCGGLSKVAVAPRLEPDSGCRSARSLPTTSCVLCERAAPSAPLCTTCPEGMGARAQGGGGLGRRNSRNERRCGSVTNMYSPRSSQTL